MAIKQPDSEPFPYLDYFGDSQVILVPIHDRRIGEEGYERMLREARHFADTYDKILVGVLEAYSTYQDHPILGNIPVVPVGQAGEGNVPRPLTLYDSREEGWRAVAEGLAGLLEPYRTFIQQDISGNVFFDKEQNAWCFDKGRKDGVSIWNREVQVQTLSGAIGMAIQTVLPEITLLRPLAGFNVSPEEQLQASISHRPQRYINFLAEDHADNTALIKELQEDQELQRHGIRWTKQLARLEYVLHFTQTHCYLTRAFEDTEGGPEENALNPYRPLTKPIELSLGKRVIREFLKQVVIWELLRRMEAPFNKGLKEEDLEIKVFHSQGRDWEELSLEGGFVGVPLWAKQQKEGVGYENTIQIQVANRSERRLYVSAFLLSNYFGTGVGLFLNPQFELEPGEQKELQPRGKINIGVELSGRSIAYNVPNQLMGVKFLAKPEPFSMEGFDLSNLPGPPGSFFQEEERYVMEKGQQAIYIETLEGEWIAPLLMLRFVNPVYDRPQKNLLDILLRRPDAEPFLRALYFDSHQLALRYKLKQKMNLEEGQPSGSMSMVADPSSPSYVHVPDGWVCLEYQLQQLRSQLQGKPEKPIFIALGDSWFNQAKPVDIPRFLMEDFIVVHAPLQDWGQLEEAVRRAEKMIETAPSITLLLSPQGERVLDNLEGLVQEDAPDDAGDIRKILRDDFFHRLDEMAEDWEKQLAFLSRLGPRLQVVVHGYDYFALEEFGGLAFYRRPDEWRRNLSAFVTDLLNARLRIVLNNRLEAANIHYLDLRNTLDPQDWTATLIPADAGFRKLAGEVSLFIAQQYQWEEEPYPGTEYFLWQMAKMNDEPGSYMDLIEAYPQGEHRAWAEEQLKKLQSAGSSSQQAQAMGSQVAEEEPEELVSLRRRANELISSNDLSKLFQLLDRELLRDTPARERFEVYRKEYEQLEKQRRRYKRPSKQLDRDMASLADAVGELVEGLEPLPAPPKEGSLADIEPSKEEGKGSTSHESTNDPINQSPKTSTFTDPRDGRTYRTVELNGLVWMAENLNFDAGEGSWHYKHDADYGEKYGRLYTWEAAYWACPPGWRLPTDEEWSALMNSFGDGEKAYEALIEGGVSRFDAVLGGRRTIRGNFYDLELLGGYWSGTEKGTQDVWCYYFHSDTRMMSREDFEQARGFSCRCVRAID